MASNDPALKEISGTIYALRAFLKKSSSLGYEYELKSVGSEPSASFSISGRSWPSVSARMSMVLYSGASGISFSSIA